jgi:hypothetical protein
MTITPTHQNANPHSTGHGFRNTLANYFARYRFALYSIAAAGLAAGVLLNWHWLAAVGVLPFLLLLPCMVMMLRCMKHGAQDQK